MVQTMAESRKRIGIYVDTNIYTSVEKLANTETRSLSNMAERLIVEALEARGELENEEQ